MLDTIYVLQIQNIYKNHRTVCSLNMWLVAHIIKVSTFLQVDTFSSM